jgi:hypothetical protein
MKLTQNGFAAEYDAEIVGWIPASTSCLRFRDSKDYRRNPENVLVSVTPHNGSQWHGEFAGSSLLNKPSGVFATPDPLVTCVLAYGQAYLVDVKDPSRHEIVSLVPIEQVIAIPSAAAVVLVSCTKILPWKGFRKQPTIHRVSSDGIRALRSEGSCLFGQGWLAHLDRWIDFSFDADTGVLSSSEPIE